MPINLEIKSNLEKIRDYLYGGGYPDPLSNAEQLSFLFFFNLYEKLDENLLVKDKNYKSIFKGKWKIKNPNNKISKDEFLDKNTFKWSVWSNSFTGEALVSFVKFEVFPFFSEFGNSLGSNFMEDARLVIDEPNVFSQIIKLINKLKLDNYDTDTKGDLFEFILKQIRQAGELGQFRTPRHIIEFITNVVQPKIGEKIYDPSAGTAGFLVSAYNHIKTVNSSSAGIKIDKSEGYEIKRGVGDKLSKKEFKLLQDETFFGHDVDPKMTRLSTMNLILRGLSNVRVIKEDVITTNINKEYKIENKLPLNGFDVILANPPFSGTIDKDRISNSIKVGKSKDTEVLFLKYIFNSLNENGRVGVIVPEGILSNSYNANKLLRKILIEEYSIDAIVCLPAGVFKPYSGVKTSIIFFKKQKNQSKKERIFFYQVKNDGFKLDANHSKPINENDLPYFLEIKDKIPELEKKWIKRNKDEEWTNNWWFADTKKIIKKDFILSASFYKPFLFKVTNFTEANIILKNINSFKKDFSIEMEKLDKLISKNSSNQSNEIAKLSDEAEIIMGQSPLGKNCNEIGDGVPLLGGPSEMGEQFPKKIKFTTVPTKLCKKGDILISVRGTIGIINTSDDVYCLGRGVAAIRPKKNNGKNNVSIDYIKQSLRLYNTYLKYKGLGAIIKGIKKEDLKNIKLFKFDLKYENFLNEIFNSIELLSYNFNKVNKDYISSFQDSIFIKYWNNIDDLFKEDD